MNILF